MLALGSPLVISAQERSDRAAKHPNSLWVIAEEMGPEEELYDLRREVETWLEVTSDQGRFSENPEVVEYYGQRMKESYDEEIERLREEWGVQ